MCIGHSVRFFFDFGGGSVYRYERTADFDHIRVGIMKNKLSTIIALCFFVAIPTASNACVGSIGPGGPCSIGPGGGLSIGPGGGLSIGPGGGLSIGPGGGLSIGPGGGRSIGPGGGESIGPGGGRSIGPGNRWIDVPGGGRWKLGQ